MPGVMLLFFTLSFYFLDWASKQKPAKQRQHKAHSIYSRFTVTCEIVSPVISTEPRRSFKVVSVAEFLRIHLMKEISYDI